jgi:hypothetical protein
MLERSGGGRSSWRLETASTRDGWSWEHLGGEGSREGYQTCEETLMG